MSILASIGDRTGERGGGQLAMAILLKCTLKAGMIQETGNYKEKK